MATVIATKTSEASTSDARGVDLTELQAEPTYCYAVLSMKHEHDETMRII